MAKLSHQQLEEVLREYQAPLIGYAASFVEDLDRAKDIVQDTFIKLSKQPRDKVEKGIKTWLFTVCRNASLDLLRKEKRLVSLNQEELPERSASLPSPAEQVDLTDRHCEVLASMEELSENQREVIRLKYQQGLSYREIAEVTGLKEGNVGFLLHTGLKRLREMLPEDLNPCKHS